MNYKVVLVACLLLSNSLNAMNFVPTAYFTLKHFVDGKIQKESTTDTFQEFANNFQQVKTDNKIQYELPTFEQLPDSLTVEIEHYTKENYWGLFNHFYEDGKQKETIKIDKIYTKKNDSIESSTASSQEFVTIPGKLSWKIMPTIKGGIIFGLGLAAAVGYKFWWRK